MVIQGTGADTLLSYGHDPCPGLAAVGTPYMQGGIDKGKSIYAWSIPLTRISDSKLTFTVVGHLSIEREFGGVHRIAQQWVAAVRASRMTNIKVVVFIRDHNADPASIPMQIQVNTDAYDYAHSIGPAAISIETRWQQNLPSPYESLFVNQDRSIWVGHKRVG